MHFFHKHTSAPPWKVGMLQMLVVVLYILIGASFVTSPLAQRVHDALIVYPPAGILAFLTTFVFSALLCGTAMLGYPALLCFEKEYRRAASVVLWSIAWLAIFLAVLGLFALVLVGGQSGY